MKCPCKDCLDRKLDIVDGVPVTCHASCKLYIDWIKYSRVQSARAKKREMFPSIKDKIN